MDTQANKMMEQDQIRKNYDRNLKSVSPNSILVPRLSGLTQFATKELVTYIKTIRCSWVRPQCCHDMHVRFWTY